MAAFLVPQPAGTDGDADSDATEGIGSEQDEDGDATERAQDGDAAENAEDDDATERAVLGIYGEVGSVDVTSSI